LLLRQIGKTGNSGEDGDRRKGVGAVPAWQIGPAQAGLAPFHQLPLHIRSILRIILKRTKIVSRKE
jgi:hypothetical protein